MSTDPAPDAQTLRSRRVRMALRDANLGPAQLRSHFSDPDPAVRRAVLDHPQCPPALRVHAVVHDHDDETRAAAASALGSFAALPVNWQPAPAAVRLVVAGLPESPTDQLTQLALDDADYQVRSRALQRLTPLSADTAWAILSRGRQADCDIVLLQWHAGFADASKMADSPHEWLRNRFAASPDTDPALLVRYALGDPSSEVRATAVANHAFPARWLPEVLARSSASVRRAALDHPRVDEGTVALCAKDADAAIRVTALTHPRCPPGSMPAGLDDPDAEVRLAAARNPNCPKEALARAVCHADAGVRRAAAENPQCPPEAVAIACGDPVEEVRVAAAGHPDCPVEALGAACADASLAVRLAALRNPRPAPATAVWIALRESQRRWYALFRGPGRSSSDVPGILHTQIHRAARQALSRADWPSLEGLPLELLPASPLDEVIAHHLPAAAADHRVELRLAAAWHEGADAQTLIALSSDPDDRVRRAASDRLLHTL